MIIYFSEKVKLRSLQSSFMFNGYLFVCCVRVGLTSSKMTNESRKIHHAVSLTQYLVISGSKKYLESKILFLIFDKMMQ